MNISDTQYYEAADAALKDRLPESCDFDVGGVVERGNHLGVPGAWIEMWIWVPEKEGK